MFWHQKNTKWWNEQVCITVICIPPLQHVSSITRRSGQYKSNSSINFVFAPCKICHVIINSSSWTSMNSNNTNLFLQDLNSWKCAQFADIMSHRLNLITFDMHHLCHTAFLKFVSALQQGQILKFNSQATNHMHKGLVPMWWYQLDILKSLQCALNIQTILPFLNVCFVKELWWPNVQSLNELHIHMGDTLHTCYSSQLIYFVFQQ